jgi:hypothetical protein
MLRAEAEKLLKDNSVDPSFAASVADVESQIRSSIAEFEKQLRNGTAKVQKDMQKDKKVPNT